MSKNWRENSNCCVSSKNFSVILHFEDLKFLNKFAQFVSVCDMLVRLGRLFLQRLQKPRLVHSSLMHSNVMQHVTNSSLEETSWCEASFRAASVLQCFSRALLCQRSLCVALILYAYAEMKRP